MDPKKIHLNIKAPTIIAFASSFFFAMMTTVFRNIVIKAATFANVVRWTLLVINKGLH